MVAEGLKEESLADEGPRGFLFLSIQFIAPGRGDLDQKYQTAHAPPVSDRG